MRPRTVRAVPVLVAALVVGLLAPAWSREEPKALSAAERGYQTILTKPFLPTALDGEVFANLWKVWPEPLKTRAAGSDVAGRRAMTLERYGLDERPGSSGFSDGPPLQFTADDENRWALNCFACHGGSVGGQVIPGLPNSHLAFQTLSDEIIAYKRAKKIPLTIQEMMSGFVPLGHSNGTTNAVVFTITLLQFRDKDLNVIPPRKVPRFPHHDLDASPWWHYRKRSRIYIDGFGKKNARTLMQFVLVPQNKREQLQKWESDFEDMVAYISSVRAPAYPHPIDRALAAAGKGVFRKNCAKCHGTYGENPSFPTKDVPIDDVGTDRARFDAITPWDRTQYASSWLTGYDPEGIVINPKGYVAPPLDGIWATAPYFHNGSVPTLWHVLHPEQRPKVWQRTSAAAYDTERVGLSVRWFEAVPKKAKTGAQKRTYFDTTLHGKSAAGHDYPAALSEAERRALLEYLKTL